MYFGYETVKMIFIETSLASSIRNIRKKFRHFNHEGIGFVFLISVSVSYRLRTCSVCNRDSDGEYCQSAQQGPNRNPKNKFLPERTGNIWRVLLF